MKIKIASEKFQSKNKDLWPFIKQASTAKPEIV